MQDHRPETPFSLAESLGATVNGGINWTWANGFTTLHEATVFDDWCEAHGWETRGVYNDHPSVGLYSVRFR